MDNADTRTVTVVRAFRQLDARLKSTTFPAARLELEHRLCQRRHQPRIMTDQNDSGALRGGLL